MEEYRKIHRALLEGLAWAEREVIDFFRRQTHGDVMPAKAKKRLRQSLR